MFPRVFLLLLLAAPAFATEWFVSATGRDDFAGATGTEAFATLAKGLAALKPGDVLTMLPGEYRQTATATLRGTAEAPITIRAQRPGTVLVRGDAEVSGFTKVPDLRGVYSAKFDRHAEAVAERSTLRMLAARPSLGELPGVPGSWFQDAQAGLLYVHASDSQSPDQHALSVSITNASGLALIGSRHVIVEGLAFTGFNNLAYDVQQGTRVRWGLYLRDAENITVRNCTSFLNGGGIGLLGGGQGCVVEHCRAFANNARYVDIGNNINGWSVAGATFRHNQVEGAATDGSSSRGDIVFYSGGAGNVMEGNLAINAALMVKGGQQEAIVRGNIVIGRKFYRAADPTNLQFAEGLKPDAFANYADPLNHDFRLQSDSPFRATAAGPVPDRDEVFVVSPSGDDAKPGTSVKLAWRTLAHAANKAGPGDTIYVLAGTYAEALVPARSGTEKQPIRFLRRGQDRVIIDGHDELATGIDLSKTEHIEVRGFAVRNCTGQGLIARAARNLTIAELTIDATGAEGILIEKSSGIRCAHNLVRGGGGVRLAGSPDCTLTENFLDSTRGPRLTLDAPSQQTACLDHNAYAPAAPGQPLIAATATSFASLDAWQKSSALDAHSMSRPPAFDPAELQRGQFVLAPTSPLIGRGLDAGPIGSFLRTSERTPAAPQDLAIRAITPTTATLEWWQPDANTKATLEWGSTPKCDQQIEVPSDPNQIAALIALKPATEYFCRVATRGAVERLVFATSAEEKGNRRGGTRFESEIQHFTTPATANPPRTFHVSTNGDDTRDGLSPEHPWRTVAHAADEVRAGDSVLVHGGTYEEFLTLRATGDAGAPITFRAAPGEEVWLTGSERARSTAILLRGVHHVVIDGFHFRDFAYNDGQAIRLEGGSHHLVRRCFYDGRALSGYTCAFLGANSSDDLLIENCVIIGGMGEGLTLSRGARPTIRHCVFYNNNIRALTALLWDPKGTFSFHYNLICDSIPAKTGNPLLRVMDLENLRADHNLWFTRTGPEARALVETMSIAGQDVSVAKSGGRLGRELLQRDFQELSAQEKSSVFANPRIPAVAELVPPGKSNSEYQEWQRRELHRHGNTLGPLKFQDFLPAPNSPIARATDGEFYGLQPEIVQAPK
jgi:hypothetical protein